MDEWHIVVKKNTRRSWLYGILQFHKVQVKNKHSQLERMKILVEEVKVEALEVKVKIKEEEEEAFLKEEEEEIRFQMVTKPIV